MMIELPKKAHVPSQTLSDYVILISGDKKIGKTSLAAAFPDSYVLENEPENAKHLPVRQTDISSWKEFKQIFSLLQKEPKYCKTLVIDDVPSLYDYCFEAVCKIDGFDHPGDVGHGKGWKAIDREFNKWIKKFHTLSCGKIYTAHTEVKQHKGRKGKEWSREETTMGAQSNRVMDKLVHIWSVMEYNDIGERILTLRGDSTVKAGCGLVNSHFRTPDGEELERIPLGKSPEEGYQNLIRAWNNELSVSTEPKPKQTNNRSTMRKDRSKKSFRIKKRKQK